MELQVSADAPAIMDPADLVAKAASGFRPALELIFAEQRQALGAVEPDALTSAVALLSGSPRIFTVGAGRSGLALRMTAMRLMHLGLAVHVIGEATTPATVSGDVLIAASGSGTTESTLVAAVRAKRVGASVLAVTINRDTPLARLADVVLRIDAAAKLDRSSTVSQQYAGSQFEQAVLVAFDALFHALWQATGRADMTLWQRHANLE